MLLGGSFFIATAAQTITLGSRADSVKFAVIGNNGNGTREQYELAQQMAAQRSRFPFEFVLMMGDNVYGRQRPADFRGEIRAPVSGAARRGRQVLCGHRQPLAAR